MNHTFPLDKMLEHIAQGDMPTDAIKKWLLTLRNRGETHQEITAVARFIRKYGLHIKLPPQTIDTCGTGGDGAKTYNISTTVAFVVAACGLPVAKHGGRSVSSQCGSIDVLEALGISVGQSLDDIEKGILADGIGFLPASLFHPVMRHVAQARKEIASPTIFNLAAPLSHPGNVQFQLLGVYDEKWLWPVAKSLHNLGTTCSWVIHGIDDGLDEISISGPTKVLKISQQGIQESIITPEDAQLQRYPKEDLRGGNSQTNSKSMIDLLEGKIVGAYKDAVLLNAAAVLCLVGVSDTLSYGVERAHHAIVSGNALSIVQNLRGELSSTPIHEIKS